MKTLAPVPAELRPSYEEHIFDFHVEAVPDGQTASYRIEVHPRDADMDEVYALYYRPDDFSLEMVARFHPPEAAEKTVLRSGPHPFIYYERRLPIVPDFLVADSSDASSRREFKVGRYRVIQEIQEAGGQARITLARMEPLGSLRVSMDWTAGDPWWSRIECTENPPPDAPFEGRVVASGYLLKDGPGIGK